MRRKSDKDIKRYKDIEIQRYRDIKTIKTTKNRQKMIEEKGLQPSLLPEGKGGGVKRPFSSDDSIIFFLVYNKTCYYMNLMSLVTG